MQTCRSGSLDAARAHLLEVSVPTTSSQRSRFINTERLPRQSTEHQVDCLALGVEPEMSHHRSKRLVIDLNIRACHTPTRHHASNLLPVQALQGICLRWYCSRLPRSDGRTG